ncbi:hypothetical protein [Nonomuraea typhae]|uniref:hypothetical protein n=1 Tax=Nonomuraea typhae TaxID=2603600 RepID=UPI0012FBB8DB|nr:hypothetical protein [Nonomuraea typhae]
MQPTVLAPGTRVDPSWTPVSSPAEAAHLVSAGVTVVVELPSGLNAALAVASVFRWYGAQVFVTAHQDEVRQALDMTDSLAGRRPPALTRRGLA